MAISGIPIKQSSRELIVELARALEPYFADITVAWRAKLVGEFAFDERTIAALDRLNISTGCSYFCHDDFIGFFENLTYYGTRLSKLQVDTRSVARSLELYQQQCDPYLNGLFRERIGEMRAALEMFSSETFVTVSGAYFDAKTKESAALLAVLDSELSAADLDTLLSRVLRITTSTFVANFGVLLLREDESNMLHVAHADGIDLGAELDIEVGVGFSGGVAQSGEPAIVLDAAHDPRIHAPELRSHARSLWAVPLRSDSNVFGVLMIGFDKPYDWLPTERELMRAIADRSALAITRVRMTDALREREVRIAELSAHLLRVQEDERKRISRELHDETGQALMVIRLYLGMLEGAVTQRTAKNKIRETLEVVDRTIEGIRRIIGRLSPLVLQELGLIAAIRKEAKDLARNTGVKARVVVPVEVGRLAPETEAAIYRIVQESLHNVAKHAQARSVSVQVTRDSDLIRLCIEDDGVGIASTRSNSRGNSFGLAGIKERVGMLGGKIRVTSAKGKGTRIDITVPAAESLSHEIARAAAISSASGGSSYKVN